MLVNIYKSAMANTVPDPMHEWEKVHAAGRAEIISHLPEGVLLSEVSKANFELRL